MNKKKMKLARYRQAWGAKVGSVPKFKMSSCSLILKNLCQVNNPQNVVINVYQVKVFKEVSYQFVMKNTFIQGDLYEIKGNSNVILGKGTTDGKEKR